MCGWSWPFPAWCSRSVPAVIYLAYFECDRPVMRTRSLRLRMAKEHCGQTGKAAN
jgi:hypothetical protein